jgi:uncharacterized integral membrane protein
MRTLLRLIIFVPLGLLILFFAMANRTSVKISLDPFPEPDSGGLSFDAPLFLVVMASVAIGVLAGGVSSWLSHLSVRRAARQARAEAFRARGEMEELRQQALGSLPQNEPQDPKRFGRA